MHLRLCRNNPENWAGKTLPKAGSIVSFPDSFSEFYQEECPVDEVANCLQGGSVTVKASGTPDLVEVVMEQLVFPENGQIRLESNTRMVFSEADPGSEGSEDVWADRGQYQFDFKCAANWVLTGTNQNPDFAIPCYQDVAVFDEVWIPPP